jgi:hypothetical protein
MPHSAGCAPSGPNRPHAPEAHKPLFEALIDSDLPALIRANQRDAINALLEKVLGKGYRVEDLLDRVLKKCA